ncbi:hypothetical protein J7L49_06855 [Candidatus Bathyarchaeota archaeon]|nr:hypothetical protein [Candidatus Bathyarchaeota archaeon]
MNLHELTAENKLFFFGESPHLKEANGTYKVYGYAIHPLKTMHPNEWPQIRVYLAEELKKAAPTLIGKPFGIDHITDLPYKVTYATWDDDAEAVYFEGEVGPEIAQLIRDGKVKGVSIELDWEVPGGKLEYVDGVAPRNFTFTGLDLIVNLEPGDPNAWVKLVEASWQNWFKKSFELKLLKNMEVKKISLVEGVVPFEETAMASIDVSWNAEDAEQRIRKWASKDGSGNKEMIDWNKYRKAFAWYNPEQIENFNSYKLPHHDIVNGEFSVVWHGVVAAMQTLLGARGGVQIPAIDRKAVYTHLAKHYRQFNREPPEFQEALILNLESKLNKFASTLEKVAEAVEADKKSKKGELQEATKTDKAVRLREKIVELEEKAKGAEKRALRAEAKLEAFKETVLNLLPSERVYRHWGWGPQQFVFQLKRVLRKDS